MRTLLSGLAAFATLALVAGTDLSAQTAPAPVPADAAPPAVAPAPAPTAVAPPPAAAPVRGGIAIGTLPQNLSPWGMFLGADIIVQGVMVGLAFASVVTWTVWLAKSIELLSAVRSGRALLGRVERARSLDEASFSTHRSRSAVARLVVAAAAEAEASAGLPSGGVKERVASRLERLEAAAGRRMTRGTGVLATIGATAPFVGLFGTVWGIMNAFVGISKAQTTNLAVVAPGIAEALLATAIGLVAAIPAVVIYNVFARWITGYRHLLADASAEVLRHVSRDLDRAAARPMLRAAE